MTPRLRTANAEAGTVIKLLAAAGVLAPVAFTVSALAHSLTRDDHSLLRDPISALAVGPTGWIQDVTFASVGVLLIGSASHCTVQSAPAGVSTLDHSCSRCSGLVSSQRRCGQP